MELLFKYFTHFSDQQRTQFEALEKLYQEWNQQINVVSRKDINSLYEKHVLHSLAIAVSFKFPPGVEVIDIGTGGGFPGIPLAIFFPNVHFHLVDSIVKKIKVVEALRSSLGLDNVTSQAVRAEEITKRKFDFAVSRAVAPLKELWKWSLPLLKSGHNAVSENNEPVKTSDFNSGLICLKGGDLSREVEESKLHPHLIPISSLFEENYFSEKYILFVSCQTK